MTRSKFHRILDTRPVRHEAEEIRSKYLTDLINLGLDTKYGLYIIPWNSPETRKWCYAICIAERPSRLSKNPGLSPGFCYVLSRVSVENVSGLTNHDRILDTADTRPEADMMLKRYARVVVELGWQDGWGVYVKPYRIPGKGKAFRWGYAICLGPQEEATGLAILRVGQPV